VWPPAGSSARTSHPGTDLTLWNERRPPALSGIIQGDHPSYTFLFSPVLRRTPTFPLYEGGWLTRFDMFPGLCGTCRRRSSTT
jgi:hypothetical protein